jgi:hypothetical protein
VGPRAGVDGCWKSRPSRGFDPRSESLYRLRHPGPQLQIIIGCAGKTPALVSALPYSELLPCNKKDSVLFVAVIAHGGNSHWMRNKEGCCAGS